MFFRCRCREDPFVGSTTSMHSNSSVERKEKNQERRGSTGKRSLLADVPSRKTRGLERDRTKNKRVSGILLPLKEIHLDDINQRRMNRSSEDLSLQRNKSREIVLTLIDLFGWDRLATRENQRCSSLTLQSAYRGNLMIKIPKEMEKFVKHVSFGCPKGFVQHSREMELRTRRNHRKQDQTTRNRDLTSQ